MPDVHAEGKKKHFLALRFLSYLLVTTGAVSLLGVMLTAWGLYFNPGAIETFTEALGSAEAADKTHLLALAAWTMVMLLLLTIAKLAVSLIDAGLKIRRNLQ